MSIKILKVLKHHVFTIRMQRIIGEPGKDLVIKSPVGVSIVTDHGELIGDLHEPGQKVLVARGIANTLSILFYN